MNRQQIIKTISESSGVSPADVEKTLDATINYVAGTAEKGSKMEKGIKLMNLFKAYTGKNINSFV